MAALYSNNLAKNASSNHLALFPAPVPTGKVLDFTTPPDTITVVRTSNLNHYIQPPSTPSSIRKDLTMTGVVVVHLSKPARARKLRVSFVVEAVVAFPGRRWEDDVIFERTLEMEGSDEEGILLQAGPQLFEYTFVLPCTLPGFDRTPYGRVSHRVQATLIGQTPAISRLGSFFSSLRARSPSPSSGGGSAALGGAVSGSGFFGGSGGAGGVSGGSTSGNATPYRSSSPTSMDGYNAGSSAHRGRSTPPGSIAPYHQPSRSESRRSEVSPMGSRVGSPRAFTYTSPGIYEEEPPAFSIDDPGPPAFSTTVPERSVSAPGRARRTDSMSLDAMTPKRTTTTSSTTGAGSNVPFFEGEMTGSKEMWIIPLATENLDALSLDLHRRSYIEGLGTLDWALASNAVCVGGLAKFWLRLDQLSPLATVWSVRLSITQTFSLKSFRRPENDEHVFPPADVLMYRKGHLARNQAERYVLPNNSAAVTKSRDPTLDPLWEGEAVPSPDSGWGTEMTIAETVRFPDETRLRPSTIPGTITPIRVAHEFKLQIFFSIWGEDAEGKPLTQNGPGQMRKFMVSQPTLIMACCCTTGILALPTYAQSMTEAHPTSEMECDVCACGQPLHELAEREIARDFMPGGPNGSSVPANSPGMDELGERGRTGHKSVYVPEN